MEYKQFEQIMFKDDKSSMQDLLDQFEKKQPKRGSRGGKENLKPEMPKKEVRF